MKDFFAFRTMISAGLIKVVYPLGILAIFALIGVSLFLVPKSKDSIAAAIPVIPLLTWDHALMILLFGNIGWRIFCEQMILLFAIHESLNRHGGNAGKD